MVSDMNKRFAELVAATGLSKTAFGERVNLSQQYISKLTKEGVPSDRTIYDICDKYDVNEQWLRTGEGEMFIKKSRDLEIAAFMGNILKGEPDFRRRFIAVLSRMSTEEWQMLEAKIKEIASEP